MGMSRTSSPYLAHFAGLAIRHEQLAGHAGRRRQVIGYVGDRARIVADDPVYADRRQFARQFLNGGESPGTVLVSGRFEHDRQDRPVGPAQVFTNLGDMMGEEFGSGVEWIVGEARNQQDAISHQRRPRCSVMPIFSSASESANLTIFTVTASMRLSWRNSVSQTWSATASISLKWVSPSASEQANLRSM